jgi:hypothetical protein
LGALAEAFLRFSPRVAFRHPNLIFVEIGSTTHFFENETSLLNSAHELMRVLGFQSRLAISDHPAAAQAFAIAQHGFICPAGEEGAYLRDLPLPLLFQLEGVAAWPQPSQVQQMIYFFSTLGFTKLGELSQLSLVSFQERWNELGAIIWLRLHSRDAQVISPLISKEPLCDYIHLDFSVSLTSILIHKIEKSLEYLFARLQGRRLFAQQIDIIFHCEYSKAQHKITIAPHQANRNLNLFLTLVENRVDDLDLENPVSDIEIEIRAGPEKSHQFDFFEPRESERDKLHALFDLLLQADVSPGFYQILDSLRPERSWRKSLEPGDRADSRVKLAKGFDYSTNNNLFTQNISLGAEKLNIPKSLPNSPPQRDLSPTSTDLSTEVVVQNGFNFIEISDKMSPAESQAVSSRPRYSGRHLEAPRPTKLLNTPQFISKRSARLLSKQPIERIEDSWWDDGPARDYYFALSNTGQCLWLFQDIQNRNFYLHGYFD